MAAAKCKSDSKLITDTPYVALKASHGLSIVKILEKIDHVINGTTLYVALCPATHSG